MSLAEILRAPAEEFEVHDEPEADDLSGSNRVTTLKWRDTVIRFMRSQGLVVGRPLHTVAGVWTDRGEVDGLPDWTILCRRQKAINLPASVGKAEQHAATHGNSRVATVLYRRLRPIEDSYVLMSLAQFSELLRTLPPTAEEGARP